MARSQASGDQSADEDYIDIEVSSSSNFLCYSISSPPQTREFEFQMSTLSQDKETTTSPADELFYKGKLLPLHLPPRLQMVQKILQTSNNKTQEAIGESFTKRESSNTPLDQSCNISSSESCRVSSELNSDEYISEWTADMCVNFIGGHNDHPKKSWSTKLKQIKQSSLGQKLKASRAYVKSLFTKPTCADDYNSCAKPASNAEAEAENGSKVTDFCSNKYMKVAKKTPFGRIDNGRFQISSTTLMKSIEKEMAEENANTHRKSFSGAIQHTPALQSLCSPTSSSVSSSSSSSFSFSSSGFSDLQLLKRSTSANSELESSIEGAIAHCKQSHQLFSSRMQFVGVKRSHQASSNNAVRETHMNNLIALYD
ncbi:probable membrane-associated kinase regulator 4 [Pyrus x bretschneideri]|uniref:probable membrane-associated kinase regulator 4 n=1 Tax=Pyrus x bretschneideri TaxID=225117 RepID=UPI00202F5299|nr:probable membrane-associated kinase regulator 4 [Pyrus x bretschneideri]